MRIKMSRCIGISVPDRKKAEDFYTNVLGFRCVSSSAESGLEIDASPITLFVDEGSEPILHELVVDDAKAVRDHLLENGCALYREGESKGSASHIFIRDPFGMIFHLFEEK